MSIGKLGPINVLFVEDEPDIRIIVELALKLDPEIELTSFSSGVETLAYLDAADVHYDVGLLNIQLPTMTGIDLMRHLQARPKHAHLPIVFITANVHRQDLDAQIAAGAVGTISKPFDPIGLAERLRAFIGPPPM